MINAKILLIMETKTKLTHMEGTSGNEAIINREPTWYNNEVVRIPAITGNSLRHKLIREPGALNLIDQLGLKNKLNIPQLNFLFHGGALTESSQAVNTKKIAEMFELFPLYRLIGGSLKNQIIHGSIRVTHGIMVCKENGRIIKSLIPESWEYNDDLESFSSFVSKYQYTRYDVAKTKPDLVNDEADSRKKTDTMLYNGQAVMPGALFLTEMMLKHVSEKEIGALLTSIYLWQFSGGYLGGQSSKGHGKMESMIYLEGVDKPSKYYIDLYASHLEETKLAQIKWLEENL